jgi:transglutaminase-like putative cysteine protease
MLIHIEHSIGYRYERPVFLEPVEIRLQPRCDCTQKLVRFDLHVSPHPAGVTESLDFDGTCTSLCWFDGVHEELLVHTTSVVETLRKNPFDFIFHPLAYASLPFVWDARQMHIVAPYIHRTTADEMVRAFAEDLRAASGSSSVAFLCLLAERIAGSFEKIIRQDGAPWVPEKTLTRRTGACRDLTLFFMECCKLFGIPARFVSGYQQSAEIEEKRDLHAWAEVYLPGGGWRGFDPSSGVAVADQHIALAASAIPSGAAALTGAFRGDCHAEMHYEITVTAVGDESGAA